MTSLSIFTIPYFDDNFSYFISQGENKPTALVDCGDAGPVLDFLERKNLNLDYILATHSHYDHAGDISSLLEVFPKAIVLKPKGETRISVPAQEVSEGDKVEFGDLTINIISVPAHTNYCISYLIEQNLFVGDALFSAGCGRMFEGKPADLERAMDKLSVLSAETKIYFGHEYTLSNLKFALSVEPDNLETKKYQEECTQKIANRQHTTPSTIALEKRINPFFRIDQSSLVRVIDSLNTMTRTERMAALRQKKDQF